MKNKTVPLLKIDTDKSIYFDMTTQRLFIQEFVGPFIEKAGTSYSKSNTWIASMVGGMLVIPLIADHFETLPFLRPSLRVLLLFGVGWSLGIIVNMFLVDKSKGKKFKKRFNRSEVEAILRNSKNLKILVWTQFIFLSGYAFFFLISFWIDNLSSKNALLVLLVGFVTSLLHFSTHPFAQRKAFRIIKKQLKEGKYDE